MTSVIRKPAQISGRIRYFITLDAPDNPPVTSAISDDSSFDLPGETPGPITTDDAFLAAYGAVPTHPFTGGMLLKDMGQELVVMDSSRSRQIARFRRVQEVAGADTEGVGGTPANSWRTFWVKTWSADGTGVLVTRTG